MVFSSQIFIFLFLPIVLIIYFLLGKKLKNLFLLLSSLVFYIWTGPKYILLLIFTILINYIFGIIIDNYKSKSNIKLAKLSLGFGIIINLAILFYYKYFDFSINVVNKFFNTSFSIQKIALPLGISFFVFQGISYIVDIYRDEAKVNKNFLEIALYISFFPKLVSGPIIKYKSISDQLKSRTTSLHQFSYGVERFAFGLAKKVIISDILGSTVDTIFNLSNNGIDTRTAWIGIISYTLQIYFDFSGYSDMAIGLAHMFGFTFMENFNYPYISKSISEFWRRWHISLSTWFKEYVYIPLGGNRTKYVYLNLFIVFTLTGIWHGASYNFIIWGFWHGIFIVLERFIRNKDFYKKIPNLIKTFITLFIVIIGWVLFRASDISQAINYLSIMFNFKTFNNLTFTYKYFLNLKLITWIVVGIVLSTPIYKIIDTKYKDKMLFEIIKTALILALFIISIIFIVNSTYSPFIYFQF